MFLFGDKYKSGVLIVISVQVSFSLCATCPSFRVFFSKCNRDAPHFDDCLLKSLNKATVCYKYGDPSLNIPVLEPIRYGDFIPPVKGYVHLSLVTLNMTLPNITEWGWGNSNYTKVKSDLAQRKLVVYQTVHVKHVTSGVSGHGTLFGMPFDERNGYVTLDMLGVKQKFTIQMLPNSDELKVNLTILSVKKMKLSLYGIFHDTFIEKLVNTYFERYWRIVYKSFISGGRDVSDAAKTALGNQLFRMIDLENLFKSATDFLQ